MCQDITGHSTNWWKEHLRQLEVGHGQRAPRWLWDNATAIVRFLDEVGAVLMSICHDLVANGQLDLSFYKPWRPQIELAKLFRTPIQAGYDRGYRIKHQRPLAVQRAREQLQAPVTLLAAFKLPQLRSQAYVTYINSTAWAAQRQAALQRANYMCQDCGGRRAEEVHHLSYQRLTQELREDLLALCLLCHQQAHARRRAQIPNYNGRLEGFAVRKYGIYWRQILDEESVHLEFEVWLAARQPASLPYACGEGCVGQLALSFDQLSLPPARA